MLAVTNNRITLSCASGNVIFIHAADLHKNILTTIFQDQKQLGIID
jgi:hypothetical protein